MLIQTIVLSGVLSLWTLRKTRKINLNENNCWHPHKRQLKGIKLKMIEVTKKKNWAFNSRIYLLKARI